jgi:hypothetical protein
MDTITSKTTVLHYLPATPVSTVYVAFTPEELGQQVSFLAGWEEAAKTADLRGTYPAYSTALRDIAPALAVGDALVWSAAELNIRLTFSIAYAETGRFAGQFVTVLGEEKGALLAAIVEATDGHPGWARRIIELDGINVGHALDLDITISRAAEAFRKKQREALQ